MNQNRAVTDAMLHSVANLNLAGFRAALVHGFDINSRVLTNPATGQWIPFIEKLTRSGFASALRVLLIDTQPCQVNMSDAKNAFRVAVATGAQDSVIAAYLEASILGTFNVVDIRQAFRYALKYRCNDLALRIAQVAGFNANCAIHLAPAVWQRPIHMATKFGQLGIITCLLQNGCDIDSFDSTQSTALLVAVRNTDFDTTRLLLVHGADPNRPDRIHPNPLPRNSLLGPYGIPSFPVFFSARGPWGASIRADRLIQLLIDAGFKPTDKYWLHDTWANRNMSRNMGMILFNLVRTMPTIEEVTVRRSQGVLRRAMRRQNGLTFNATLLHFGLPWGLIQLLWLDLLV